jgi:vacuolar protein-sorting-associated protein 4
MADQAANRDKAIQIFNQATKADAGQNAGEAYRLYKLAAKHFFFVI